jgi:hypothetical protein
MCFNTSWTSTDACLQAIGALIGLSLSLYYGRLAWSLTAREFIARIQARRPPYWSQQMPVYGRILAWGDSHPRLILWQTRIGTALVGVFTTLVLIYSLVVVFPGHLGFRPC